MSNPGGEAIPQYGQRPRTISNVSSSGGKQSSDEASKAQRMSEARRMVPGSSKGFDQFSGAQFSKAIFEGRFKYLHGLHKQTYLGFNSLNKSGDARPAAFFRSSLPATPIATPVFIPPRFEFTEQTLQKKLAKCEQLIEDDNKTTIPVTETRQQRTAQRSVTPPPQSFSVKRDDTTVEEKPKPKSKRRRRQLR